MSLFPVAFQVVEFLYENPECFNQKWLHEHIDHTLCGTHQLTFALHLHYPDATNICTVSLMPLPILAALLTDE